MKRMIRAAKDPMDIATQAVNLEVSLETYERYQRGRHVTFRVSGTNLLDALKKMTDEAGLYLTSDEIDEEEMTPEDIINEIETSNGDGCDFIIYIKNLTTGEFLMDYRDYYEDTPEI